MRHDRLGLAEELLLLSLQDRKGTVVFCASTALPYGLAGAALLELALDGHVRLDEGKVQPATSHAPRDPALGPIVETMRASERTRSIKHWIGHLGRKSRKFKEALLDRLVSQRILDHEEGRILFVFPTRRYPEVDPRPEREIRDRVRAAVLGGRVPDARTLALISLVHACSLTGIVFEKGERKEARKRMKELAAGEPMGGAVTRVIDETTAAVMAATTAAVVAASAASSGS